MLNSTGDTEIRQLLDLSEYWFPFLKNEESRNNYLIGLLYILNEIIHTIDYLHRRVHSI